MQRDCTGWLVLFEAAFEGELPAEESRQLVEHLRGCAACRSSVRGMAMLHRLLLEDAVLQGAVRAAPGRTLSRRSERSDFWKFAAAAAALALLAANFSLSTTRGTECGLQARREAADLEGDARSIRELLPELSEREARRQALLLRVGKPSAPLPVLRGTIRARGSGQ
jgi:hypothetical protein